MRRILPTILALSACSLEPPPFAPVADSGAETSEDAGVELEDSGVAGCPVGAPGDRLTVATDRGLVRGTEAGGTVRFAGIPFAAPPIGPLRLRPPEAPACWSGTLEAREYGPICPQLDVAGQLTGDEDCLSLNVWTPAGALRTRANLPVLFWIHGGANVVGSSTGLLGATLYDGQHLAESQQVVVVSANYRLGALGFLVHPALAAESPRGVSGNYAILDLIAALEWVKENIASFGGDPSRVLVFGESAGAFNTCVLLGSPLASGLFSSALMQSGSCRQPAAAMVERQNEPMIAELGCGGAADVAACLRAAPVESFVRLLGVDLLAGTLTPPALDRMNPNPLPFGASVDGWVLPRAAIESMETGGANDVPFIIGSNANEHDLFVPFGTVPTCGAYENNVTAMFPTIAAQVLEQYPCRDYATPRFAWSDVQTDVFFTCPTRKAARAAASGQTAPVRRYYFTHGRTLGPLAAYRAAHAMEIAFVFGMVGRNGDVATPAEVRLSERMQAFWARLAAGGDPNGVVPEWDAYQPARDNAIVLDDEISSTERIKSAQCDFWDGVLAF